MKDKDTGTFTVIALAAVAAVLLAFCRSCGPEAVYPIEHAQRTFADKVFPRITGFFRGAAASAENARLRREVAALAVLRTDVDRLSAENDRLRKALGYTAHARNSWIAAAVLSRDGAASGAGRTLRTDKGSLAGVREGAIVMAPAGLVGRVQDVTPHTSSITLLADPQIKVACEIESAMGRPMRGILCGGTADGLVLRQLTESRLPEIRARVITAGVGGVFPRGLEVGSLIDIRTNATHNVLSATVQPAVDCDSLEDVFIRSEK